MQGWTPDSLGGTNASPQHVALVVGHEGLRRDLERALSTMGFASTSEDRLRDALRLPRVDVIVLDLDVSRESVDLDTICEAAGKPVIGLTGDPALRSAPAGGRPALLAKPFSIADLERALREALGGVSGGRPAGGLDPLLQTREPSLLRTLERARQLAEVGHPIVIQGELGTGRQALAEALHRWSPRGAEARIVLDRTDFASASADDAEEALRSALEGVSAGAVVVVEPAEWSDAAQIALASRLRDPDGRRWLTIASIPLDEACEAGRLAREVADRLDVARVSLPALRDRGLDHRTLCEAIARRVARELGRPTPNLEAETIEAWGAEGFPGNRLGLESRIRAAMLEGEPQARRSGAPLEVRRHADEASTLDLKRLERDTIVRALAHWQGNRTRASESLGISVRTLRNKIREYGLR